MSEEIVEEKVEDKKSKKIVTHNLWFGKDNEHNIVRGNLGHWENNPDRTILSLQTKEGVWISGLVFEREKK